MHMYNNTGQSCNAPSRMLVPRDLLSEAEAIAAKVTESVVIGPTAEDSTTMGPVVSKVQWDKIQALIEGGIAEGAKVVCGGPGLPDGIDRGYYVRPTVFSDVTNDMSIAEQEIFGPVLVMIPYDTEEEAIQIANDTPYGLAGYVQAVTSTTREKWLRVSAPGNVHINGASPGMDVPFGGYKQSGNGREWECGFTDYLEIKPISGFELPDSSICNRGCCRSDSGDRSGHYGHHGCGDEYPGGSAGGRHEFPQIYPKPGWVEHDPRRSGHRPSKVFVQFFAVGSDLTMWLVSASPTSERRRCCGNAGAASRWVMPSSGNADALRVSVRDYARKGWSPWCAIVRGSCSIPIFRRASSAGCSTILTVREVAPDAAILPPVRSTLTYCIG